MLELGRSIHRWYKISFVLFAVGLPALGLFAKGVLIPSYLWLRRALALLIEYEAAAASSSLFMGALLLLYLTSLGFVVYLFVKNCKRAPETPSHS